LPIVLSIVGERRHRRYGNTPTVAQIGSAIAEALHALDLSTAGADAGRMRIGARGDLRGPLDAGPASAAVFAHALAGPGSPIPATSCRAGGCPLSRRACAAGGPGCGGAPVRLTGPHRTGCPCPACWARRRPERWPSLPSGTPGSEEAIPSTPAIPKERERWR